MWLRLKLLFVYPYLYKLLRTKSTREKKSKIKKWNDCDSIAHINILFAFVLHKYVGTGIRIKNKCKLMVFIWVPHKARTFCSGALPHADAGHLHTWFTAAIQPSYPLAFPAHHHRPIFLVYTQLKKRRRPNHAVIFIISLFLSAMISYLSQCYPPRHLLFLSLLWFRQYFCIEKPFLYGSFFYF